MPHFTLFDHVHTIYESDSVSAEEHTTAAVAQWSIVDFTQGHSRWREANVILRLKEGHLPNLGLFP